VRSRDERNPVPTAGRVLAILGALGRVSRARAEFVLTIGALAFGVIRELGLTASWRRPVRAEFARALRQGIGGGMLTTIVAAALIGVAMVYQALFWLGEAGQERLIGSILVAVLVREVAPLIVGLILLGRSGIVTAAEIDDLQSDGQLGRLEAQGIDPFLLLVLPRAVASALACYTLGIVFVLAAMAIGYAASNVAGGVQMSLWEFLTAVLDGMLPADFVVFPAKMLVIGLLLSLTSVATGLRAGTGDNAGNVLPRAFVRGTLAVMLTSVTLSLAI
jgi:phospholipid/cholesterol/gamma-HCH transport system permease protein